MVEAARKLQERFGHATVRPTHVAACSPKRLYLNAWPHAGCSHVTSSSTSSRGFAQLARCALCERQMEREHLSNIVSFNAIHRQREAWGVPAPARALTARYDAAKVCGFCFQFFDTKPPTAEDVRKSEDKYRGYRRPVSARPTVGAGTKISDPAAGKGFRVTSALGSESVPALPYGV